MKKHRLNWLTLGTSSVCGLIILFAAFALYSADNISDQMNRMYRHPYVVKGEAMTMRTRILEMRLYLMPSILASSSTNTEDTLRMLEDRDRMQDKSFAVIQEYYLGKREDVSDLQKSMLALRAARKQALLDCEGITDPQKIMAYLDENLVPLNADMDAVLQRISAYADKRVEIFRKNAGDTRNSMFIGSVLLCALLIALIILINVNERRKNQAIAYREELFNLLSHSTADVFLIYDCENSRLEYVSENSEQMLGITPQEFYHNPAALKRGMISETDKELTALLADNNLREPAEYDFKYHNSNNQSMDLKLRVYPAISNGKAARSIGVISDQTKTIAQQAALSDALFSAQKANDAKQEFLSRMSHEIRTPMNAIIGMTIIAMKYLDKKERVSDCLGKIAVSSKHLLSLINDVLDIAKIEGGKLSFSHGPFNFRNFINTLTAIVYPQTIARQQKFEITISGLIEETLIGDELRLNQMLINLLSNAIKFTPSGGEIRLEITRLQSRSSRAMLRFVVSDTGIGMSKEFLERLYTPFEQADSIAQNYGGTGLGMSITKNLVSLMSGSIAVQSEEGKGTAFTLELPFELPEDGALSRSEELSSLKVLVADDDQITCEHAVLLLEQLGVSCDWATSGAEAVKKVTQAHEDGHDYDVCFIDWRMPGMDGLETTRNLRGSIGLNTPIIIISSYDWTAIEQDAREVGVTAFISKPLFASSLYNALISIQHPEAPVVKPYQEQEQYNFNGKKVLLAEDNPLNQEIALEILQSAGLSVDCANDGQEALDMYQRSKEGEYSLILMDVQMPRLDGYKATRIIRDLNRSDAKSIPILAMTANAFSSDILAAEEAGMNGHLAKPIDMPVLFRTIAMHLGQG